LEVEEVASGGADRWPTGSSRGSRWRWKVGIGERLWWAPEDGRKIKMRKKN
jgi:hypothetical protein